MALYDSADIIRRAKLELNRPAADTAFGTADAILYDFATEEQDEITKWMSVFIPDALVTAPTQLTTADGGYTYTFGTDTDTAAIFALGHFALYSSRHDIPDFPLEPGVDFLVEGTRIRIPNHQTRTFADGAPWAQTVNPSNVIASGTQPTIPKICRKWLIHRIAKRAAESLDLDTTKHENNAKEAEYSILAAVRCQALGKGGPPLRHRNRFWRSGPLY
jgi:hypothetical protein